MKESKVILEYRGMQSLLEILHSAFLNLFRINGCCPCSGTSGNDELPQETHDNFLENRISEAVKFKTWPEENLKCSLEKILLENKVELEDSYFSVLFQFLKSEINSRCPFDVEEQYDFCVICSSHDWDKAKQITRSFEEKFDLLGHVIWESLNLGEEQFDVFEDIVARSSKVIFYITENFTNDSFCRHLASNTFTGNAEQTKEKSVPIMDKKFTPVQNELLLISKLTMDNHDTFDTRFRYIFSESVKREKYDRRKNIEMLLDKTRLDILKEAWASKLNESYKSLK